MHVILGSFAICKMPLLNFDGGVWIAGVDVGFPQGCVDAGLPLRKAGALGCHTEKMVVHRAWRWSSLVRNHLGKASPGLGNPRFLGTESREGLLPFSRGSQAARMKHGWKPEPRSRRAAGATLRLFGQGGMVGSV